MNAVLAHAPNPLRMFENRRNFSPPPLGSPCRQGEPNRLGSPHAVGGEPAGGRQKPHFSNILPNPLDIPRKMRYNRIASTRGMRAILIWRDHDEG